MFNTKQTFISNSSRILRSEEVMKRVGLALPTLVQRMAKRTFPQSVRLGRNIHGWLESEIEGWISAQFKARKTPKSRGAKSAKPHAFAAKPNLITRFVRTVVS
jgi:predicted DNA-binding transcriptional regulator AlpA